MATAFLDIKKVYDWVDRKLLWKVVEDLGYGGRIVSLFIEMYHDTTTTVKLGVVETGEIPVEVGLKQGCVLSPMLFLLYLHELEEELMASGDGVWIGSEGNERKIPGFFFVDDMILIADSKRGLQCLLNIVGRFGVHQKLTFSPEKSKVIVNWRKPI